MYSRPLGVAYVICWCSILALESGSANAQNLLTDVGTGTATGINNAGQVLLSNGIYSNGIVTAFPTGFSGRAINASGQVAGNLAATFTSGHAALYSNGTVTLIGDDATFVTLGINDSGVVVGQGSGNDGQYIYGIIYNNGQLTDLGTFPGSSGNSFSFTSQANGINNVGQVTGSAFNNSGFNDSIDAFVYDINSATWIDIGPGEGVAINSSGQVLLRDAIYSNGLTTPIPIGGYAFNATAQVVGENFFYSGGIIDLNDLVSATDPLKPFVKLTGAVGINDSLLIAVNGVDSRTELTHAYLVQAPAITLSPGPLTFSNQAIGTLSAAQTVTVTNAGATPLAIDGISISGAFQQTNNCVASLAPSAACVVMVTFRPPAAGDQDGNLTFTTSGVPVIVPLSGTAPIQSTITSSPSTATTGVPFNLTWTISPGASCVATGGSAADGWIGAVNVSGSQSVTETTAANYSYGLSCKAGSQSQSSQTTVFVYPPPLTVALTASPSAITSGKSTTLTWRSTNAKTCTASGGGTDDGWAGTTLATSGSTTITEPIAVASPLTLTYTLTCSNSGTGQTTPASTKVVINPPAKSGGGGSLDSFALLLLAGMATYRLRKGPITRSSSSGC